MANSGEPPGYVTRKQIARLAAAISAYNMESIAEGYLDICNETVKNMWRENQGKVEAFNRDVLRYWANKNSGPSQIQNLADLLFEGAKDCGYVDPKKVEEILGMSPRDREQEPKLPRNSVPGTDEVTEEEFLTLAEDLQPHMEQTMKIEVAPWIKEYVTDMDDLYSELSLEKLNDRACGQLSEKLNSYKELFTDQETPKLKSDTKVPHKKAQGRKILFKGKPGVGKTTLMKKITFDWAKGIFTAVSIVFFVFLKLVNPGDAIENVIIDQTPVLEGLDVTGSKIAKILKQFGPRCLLILDGLDEHALGQNEDVIRIMKGQKYLFCNVVVTSRPHSTRDIQKYFQTIVSVEGFTYSEAEKFACRILSDRHKIDQVLTFNPGTGRDRGLHSVPILLSFMCLLVKEDDDIDLTSGTSNVGEIYARMVRCLYKNFTIRKNKEFQASEFVKTLELLGKLALETLLSNKPLMTREKVMREVGSDAFEYGLLIGHEDAHRLIRDETTNIMVTFPHMTIWEFLGSFYFVCRLSSGENVEAIIGSGDKTPIFLMNPLFLQFCLWFLQKSDEYFTFERKQEAYDSLVSYTTQLVGEEILDWRRLPGLDEQQIEDVMSYLRDVLAQCHRRKHLILGTRFCTDNILRCVFENTGESLESIEISDNHSKKYSQAEYKKYLSPEFERSNELKIIIQWDDFRQFSRDNKAIAMKTLRKYCGLLKKDCYYKIISSGDIHKTEGIQSALQKQISGGSRNFPRWGRQPSGGEGVQYTILPNFHKNCMKLKEFGRPLHPP